MNPNEQEIENLLRLAPKPVPPAGLKQQLFNQIELTSSETSPRASITNPLPGGWWRRWWPALAPAAVSAACAVVLTVQQAEIRNLKETIRTLSSTTTTETAPPTAITQPDNSAANQIDLAAKEQEEITRLKERVKLLTTEIGQLEQTQRQNEALRRQIAAPPTLTQEEMDALAKAKEKALAIQCVNNLKWLGMAARQWAIENNNHFPPDTLSMSNDLNTPKILVCPADTNRPVAASWAGFTSANCSYEYLSPSTSSDPTEPDRVQFRCPIHGHIGLCDGSIQGSVGKNHPEWLVERNGKLFYQDPSNADSQPMMPRPILILASIGICIAALALTLTQCWRLAALSGQEQALQAQVAQQPLKISDNTILTETEHAPSIELLRLRGEIGQLERRKRELADVNKENAQLRIQLATEGTNSTETITLPPGSIRTSEARYLGYKTPEDTVETLLWAVRTHNSTHLWQAYAPETVKRRKTDLQRLGRSFNRMIEETNSFPELRIIGLRIISRLDPLTDDLLVLETEAVPDDQANLGSLRFRKVEGEWKLVREN